MTKKKEHSNNVRNMTVTSHTEGMGYKSILKKVNIPVSAIWSIIKKLNSCYTVINLKAVGEKKIVYQLF